MAHHTEQQPTHAPGVGHSSQRASAAAADGLALTALDAFESPIYIVDAAARLMLTNRMGERHLLLGLPFRLSQDALHAPAAEATQLLAVALSIAFAHRGYSVTRKIGKWFIRLVALSSHTGVAMIYVAPDDPQPLPRDTLRQVLGFSQAESEVAYMLADGWSTKEVAFSRSVSVHTIRSQVRQILQKAGVRRQTDLAKVLFSLPHLNGTVAE